MYALYFHTTELSKGQLFHKVRSYPVMFLWPVCGNDWPNGHDNDLTVKIAASELTKKAVEVKLEEGSVHKTEEERIGWWCIGADGKRRGQWGYIRTDNFVWADDETELVLKQQLASSTGSQVSLNMLVHNVVQWMWRRETGNGQRVPTDKKGVPTYCDI